jgi:hypothetical protein
MTLHADLNRLFGRELATLRDELLAYPDERMIWALPPGLPNSAGTITLHLVGNLRWFIGAYLGASGYVRDRPLEFSQRDVPRATLIGLIETAADEVTRALASCEDSELERPYPKELASIPVSTARWLQHLASHLAYHLGQVDYHRRIVTGSSVSVGALPLALIADL